MTKILHCITLYLMGLSGKLVWDEWNKKHIKKHQVTVAEVEEVYNSKVITKQSYLGRTIILGRAKNGRLLTIIVSTEKQKQPYTVSAREMSKKERRYYYEQTQTHKTI